MVRVSNNISQDGETGLNKAKTIEFPCKMLFFEILVCSEAKGIMVV
jgi:hypothetical protein